MSLLTLSNVGYSVGNLPRFSKQNRLSTQRLTQDWLVFGVNMNIDKHEVISLIGPNGAGKSTLVKLILGLLTPTTGNIIKASGLQLGYVPQKFSVEQILPLRVKDLLQQANKNRLSQNQRQQLLTALSITPLLTQQLSHLSGGEMQRVLLARALLEKPDLLILDEPMQGLDPETESDLYQFIDHLPDFLCCAMLVVSHDLHWVMQGSRHVVCLNKHICCQGQPADIGMTDEFKQLFGHQYQQPYIHKPHHCEHDPQHDLQDMLAKSMLITDKTDKMVVKS